MCVLAIAMLENLTVLTMEVLYSLWLPSGHDRPILRVYARGDREDGPDISEGSSRKLSSMDGTVSSDDLRSTDSHSMS